MDPARDGVNAERSHVEGQSRRGCGGVAVGRENTWFGGGRRGSGDPVAVGGGLEQFRRLGFRPLKN
jgi:hypothetical protein